MGSTQSLAIKYAPVFPIFMLLCCLVMLYAALVVGPSPTTILAVVLSVVSILMLTRPIVFITPMGVEMRNLLGMTVKSIAFKDNPPLSRGNAFYCGGTRVFPQWMVNTKLVTVEQFLQAHGVLPA
jgi:hypothetical protein